MSGNGEESHAAWRKGRWLAAGIVLLLLAGLAILPMLRGTVRKGAQPRERLVIASTYNPSTLLLNLAWRKGFFRERGLDDSLRILATGKDCLREVLDGNADIGAVADTPVMFAGLEGEPFLVLATIGSTERGTFVLGRKDRGIAEGADLKGKRIGVPIGTSAHFLLDSLLTQLGIRNDEVTMVDMKPPAMQEALAAGSVDAVAIWQPYGLGILRAMAGRVVAIHEDLYMERFAVVAHRDYVKRNPQVVRRILEALLAAEAQVRERRPDAEREMAEMTKLPLPDMKALMDEYAYEVRLYQSYLTLLEAEARWAIRNRLTGRRTVPDFLDHVYPEGLSSVHPDAVTIIH